MLRIAGINRKQRGRTEHVCRHLIESFPEAKPYRETYPLRHPLLSGNPVFQSRSSQLRPRGVILQGIRSKFRPERRGRVGGRLLPKVAVVKAWEVEAHTLGSASLFAIFLKEKACNQSKTP